MRRADASRARPRSTGIVTEPAACQSSGKSAMLSSGLSIAGDAIVLLPLGRAATFVDAIVGTRRSPPHVSGGSVGLPTATDRDGALANY